MKNSIRCACALTVLSILAGCGGGGDAASATSSSQTASELEGTWVAASDGRFTGPSCGLDTSGARGERTTLKFNMNRYSYTTEACAILTGNTGSYLTTDSGSGTFAIGGIILASADPGGQMRALDLISTKTVYTSYNLVDNRLRIAMQFQTYDGSTREKRAFQIASYYDPATRTLVSAPVFVKQ